MNEATMLHDETSESIAVGAASDRQGSLDLLVQSLPPVHDAIGEYTSCLAEELARTTRIQILTPRGTEFDSIENVTIEPCYDASGSKRFSGLRRRLLDTTADAVVVQYNPFCWGRRGWAPDLTRLMQRLKLERPDFVLSIMFHETYMMNPGVRSWVMRQYQKRQYYQLLDAADFAFFSTELWCRQQQSRRPSAHLVHLPVGSNLPKSDADPVLTRERWGILPDDFVCGVFGGAHPSRMMSWIEAAVNEISRTALSGRRVVFLHVGGERINWSISSAPTIATGRLHARDAADAIATMDLMINPFSDGISTRRGSAMAALENGVPVVSTRGHATDSIWHQLDQECVFLAPPDRTDTWNDTVRNVVRRIQTESSQLRNSAATAYEANFSWPVIASTMLAQIGQFRRKQSS